MNNNIYLVSHWELIKHDLLHLIPQLDIYLPFSPNTRLIVEGTVYYNPYVYLVPTSKLLTYFQLRNIGNYASRPLNLPAHNCVQYFS